MPIILPKEDPTVARKKRAMQRDDMTEEECDRAIAAYRRTLPHLEELFLNEMGPFDWPAGGWRSVLNSLSKHFYACTYRCVELKYNEAMDRLEQWGGGRFHNSSAMLKIVDFGLCHELGSSTRGGGFRRTSATWPSGPGSTSPRASAS